MDPTSISNRPTLDIDEIMSDDFDVSKVVDQSGRRKLELLRNDQALSPLADQIEDRYRMSAFIDSITDVRRPINATATMFEAVTGQDDSTGAWESIKNSWRMGRNQMDRAELRWQEMLGRRQINWELPPVGQLPTTKDNWFVSSLNSATNILPMQIDAGLSGAKYGLATGAAAAGLAAAAGQAGPQVALPEEAVTVPGAFAIFGALGTKYGAAKRAMELEAGLEFEALIQMRGPNGERIDPNVARAIASGVGFVNGLLELAQIETLVKTIPGAKKVLRNGIRQSIRKMIANHSLLRLGRKHLGSYGKTIATETAQEIAQESTSIIGDELAKYIRNQADEGKISHADAGQILERLTQTATESIKGFSVLAAPGHIGGTVVDVIDNQQVRTAEKVAPDQQIRRETEIVPRIDPLRMVEKAPGAPQEAVTAPEVAPVPTQPLEAQEQAEVAQIEANVAAELPATVKPNLYIGNVTQRMKSKFAEIWGTEEADVKPFLDGPFPTKRTAIEMTGDQAMETLVVLEESLNQRLDDNLISTESDLARANADWGDIKELRNVLGLPEAKRPFTVHRAKYGVLTPEQVAGKIGIAPELSREQSVIGALGKRILFTVQKSAADVIRVSRIDQLNNVMRRMRKAAKEGYAEARKEYRQAQYLKKQIEIRNRLIDRISKTPSKNIDPFYANAIKRIQSAIDFSAQGKKLAEKESLRSFLDQNPDKKNEIPSDLVEALDKRDIESFTTSQLQQILEEVQRLSKLGRLKSKLLAKQRVKAKAARIAAATEAVRAARKPKGPTAERAWTLRPLRLLDMLDGMKKFAGTLVTMFDTAIQDKYDQELRHTDHRQQRGLAKLKELGLTLTHFAKRRKVGDVTMTVDDMCGIYAGWMNEQSRLALQYGGIRMENGQTLLITQEIYDQVVEALTAEEKRWAEFIIEEYADNWERIRNAVLETENRDLGRVTNYTKIRRIGVDKADSADVLAGFDYSDESDYRSTVVKVHDKFTKERQQIPPEYQLPIETSLTRIWESEIRKQEHYIAMARLLKDLNAVVRDKGFKEAVTEMFGDKVYTSIRNYLKRTADPDYYRTFDDVENISRILRKNAAMGFLAYNLLTMAKQAPSIAFYAINSSYSDLFMSAIQVAISPKKTYEAILSRNQQISHARIVREMEELKHTNPSAWTFIVRRVGLSGMRGIYEVDRAVRIIGENAVINYQMRQGLSMDEAAKKARQTSLRTQPAAGSKDIAQLYANNEILNWFTMFTNQLNQIYNVATYDVFAAWYNHQFAEVGRSVIALGVVAAWIWALQNRRLPEEPEDIFDAVTDQAAASIPVVGQAILSGKRGWRSPTVPLISTAARTSGAVFSGDMDKIMPALLEATAVSTGIPYIAIKRAYETVEEEDLWELIGGNK